MNQFIVFYTFPSRGWVGWNHWNPLSNPSTEEEAEAEFLEWARDGQVFASTPGMHYMVCTRTREKGL